MQQHTQQREQQQRDEHQQNRRSERGDEQLERLARTIDPPGREPSGDELIDPGRASPDRRPADNWS